MYLLTQVNATIGEEAFEIAIVIWVLLDQSLPCVLCVLGHAKFRQ